MSHQLPVSLRTVEDPISTGLTYRYNGGVVGNFVNPDTGAQYIIVVNTDTVNAKNVAVNLVGAGGGVPASAQEPYWQSIIS